MARKGGKGKANSANESPASSSASLNLTPQQQAQKDALPAVYEPLFLGEGAYDARRAAALALVKNVVEGGWQTAFEVLEIAKTLQAAFEDKKQNAREGAVYFYQALLEDQGAAAEPFVVESLPALLNALGDKAATVRDSALATLTKLFTTMEMHSLKSVLNQVLRSVDDEKKWQTKQFVFDNISAWANKWPALIAANLPDIVPVASGAMWSTKKEVVDSATTCMRKACEVVGNPDIVPFIDHLLLCIAHPENVPETVHKLAATTFVTEVKAPTLAIMVPLMKRGLSEKKPAVLRQTCVIIDNMCKLVENPQDAEQFLPSLMPAIERIIEIAADPELRQVADRARATLVRVGGGNLKQEDALVAEAQKMRELHHEIRTSIGQLAKKIAKVEKLADAVVDYVATFSQSLDLLRDFEAAHWAPIAPKLTSAMSLDNAKKLVEELRLHYVEMDAKRIKAEKEVDEEEGEVLCDCDFSLAYGGMILLNNAHLKLQRGQRYGLLGPNGSGKTTLMRAIAEDKLEGFPSPDELRTVFVEHSLQAEDADFPVIDFVANDEKLQKQNIKREEIAETLASVGFTPDMQAQPVGSLSGGWKMKLELARAMLMHADILLLDEPTNHLDVANVKWLENYLTSLSDVTSIIVSHDSGFIDNVCTNIVHYESRKLKTYKGNMSHFVTLVPEAKSYYELTNENLKFKFPEPGFLDGVKSKDKAILKLMHCDYTYPGTTKQILKDVSVNCALNSRVACVGPNGAGKSTLIKLLTGETEPDSGEVYKHPNLRVAYVAQHAFHHVEQHLDKTANEYIRWRFQYGEDRELLAKASRQMSEEDKAQMEKAFLHPETQEKIRIESIQGRRKDKRSFEYELKLVGKPFEENLWMSRADLEELGFQKILQAFDDKEAQKAGLYTRPLTSKNVEQHLADIGLDPEFSTHNRIRGLSGGQKVKVVLGAAMWQNPHMLVLDEPTNYLDRDALGALAEAIKEYGGGVVIISHNHEFTGAICPEKWSVNNGVCDVTGATYAPAEKLEQKEQTEVKDALGNVTKVKSTRKLTRKEIKAKEKRKAAAIKAGLVPSDSEDEL
ncbi:hypothetical protein CXG81DRAFT_11088 [Caulochytrium protostelioides]|uniref:Elongation factor 3 n=1 Tax=Caulochytrium protostelioides TaxID=1555241 RepID=A0A4P9XA09_9FUNG|nr:hypothetical protein CAUPRSCDRAFT_5396 [Caulochytrium protostelioides]RKP02178.1 hypothetical protein CXG81DRAFT_11088 [Caulochytrium protostelioides]|eukprot:RKP02178.1 hypothetical protein CXG81DRAFT_11088 [Caulochytrium protostelioides]